MAEEKRHEEQEFSFVKEKIKKQPFYQNKNLRRAGIRLLFSVLCGLAACLAFVLARPWMEQTFGKKEMTEITIPAEEEEQQDTEEDEEPEEEEAEEETAPQDPVVITQPQELEAEDYATLYAKLKEVADAAAQSLAAVTVSSSDTDWFNETYENRRQVSGLLVGNNGVEILILVPYSQVAEADRLQASLADGSTLEAVLKNYDRVTDLAILSVNLADVGEETLESIRIAELGSSRGLKAGDPVIAVGSPAGIAGSVKYGNLVAAGYQTGVTDGSYGLLITDMERSEEGSGVLLNRQRVVADGLRHFGYEGCDRASVQQPGSGIHGNPRRGRDRGDGGPSEYSGGRICGQRGAGLPGAGQRHTGRRHHHGDQRPGDRLPVSDSGNAAEVFQAAGDPRDRYAPGQGRL